MTERGVVVTGTDTGVGKTAVALALMRLYRARGLSVAGMKPVAAGSAITIEGARNDDALALQAAASRPLPYGSVNPYAFVPAIAPHLAAAEAGVTIDLDRLEGRYRELAGGFDRVVVEGAGGWLVPFTELESFGDLAARLRLPVVLVVAIRLGCLNHALLTAEAIEHYGLRLDGWVANRLDPQTVRAEQNIDALRERIGAPCLGVIPPLAPGEGAERYLRLPE